MSNLQLELLKLYAQNISDDDLLAIKGLIARYFAEKAMDAADKAWEENGWDDAKINGLLKTKLKTPYQSK